jgi:two-component system cell cycle sensor histidine kinase/response regulator CckA
VESVGGVLLEVTDTGAGMDGETVNQIFEPFFSTKAEERGTGLGLSTCYGIVKQAGGAIKVESEPGEGTAIKVFLPRAAGEPQVANREETKRDLEGSETILVVEDEASVRKMIRHILASHGYEVLESADGEQALRVVERQNKHVRLLLTDMIMPHMGGAELSELIRSRNPLLKVLYMSGYIGETASASMDLSSDRSFIQKPFTSLRLLRRIRQILDEG